MIIHFESFLINILRRPLFWQVVSLIPSWYKIYLPWYWLAITYQFFVLPFKESTFWWWERKCLGCVQGSTLTRLGDSNFRFSNYKGLTLSYVSHCCLKSFIIIFIFFSDLSFHYRKSEVDFQSWSGACTSSTWTQRESSPLFVAENRP